MLGQDNNLHQISLSILVTCLLNNVWMLYREKLHVNLFWELKGLQRDEG